MNSKPTSNSLLRGEIVTDDLAAKVFPDDPNYAAQLREYLQIDGEKVVETPGITQGTIGLRRTCPTCKMSQVVFHGMEFPPYVHWHHQADGKQVEVRWPRTWYSPSQSEITQ